MSDTVAIGAINMCAISKEIEKNVNFNEKIALRCSLLNRREILFFPNEIFFFFFKTSSLKSINIIRFTGDEPLLLACNWRAVW